MQVGLNVLQEDGKVFECHKTIHDTVWHSELGASLAILQVCLLRCCGLQEERHKCSCMSAGAVTWHAQRSME